MRRRVQIILGDGSVFKYDEGPLILWDSCNASMYSPIVDLSGELLYGFACAC